MFDNWNVLDNGNLHVFHNMYWDFDVLHNWVRLGYMDVFIDRYMFDMVNWVRFGHDDDLFLAVSTTVSSSVSTSVSSSVSTPVSASVSSFLTAGAHGY